MTDNTAVEDPPCTIWMRGELNSNISEQSHLLIAVNHCLLYFAVLYSNKKGEARTKDPEDI